MDDHQKLMFDASRLFRRISRIDTPTGPVAVPSPVASQLLNQGLISGELGGRLHANDAAIVKAAMAAFAGVCDFCSATGATQVFDVPNIDDDIPNLLSTDGWAACDTCAELVRAGKKRELLQRSVDGTSFGKFSRGAIAELHATFWKAMNDKAEAAGLAAAVGDYIKGNLNPVDQAVSGQLVLNSEDARRKRVVELSGLTLQQVDDLVHAQPDTDALAKLLKLWKGSVQHDVWRKINDVLGDAGRKPFEPVLPHWQVALDKKFEAMRNAAEMLSKNNVGAHMSGATDLDDPVELAKTIKAAQVATALYRKHLQADYDALKYAEAYSFNAETAGAITVATGSIPHDSPLSSIDTPGNGRAGWFWFAEPLSVKTTDDAPGTNALLWYWLERDGQPELWVSAYVFNKLADGGMLPAAYWCWPRTQSLHDLVQSVREAYDAGEVVIASKSQFDRETSVKGVAELSLFFLAACQWMKQRVVISAPGHVERHARKRMTREHNLKEPPTVQVIALRKSERKPTEPREQTDGEAIPRNYNWRFVVQGHFRLQRCGPGLKDVKLIWISPFIKGPDDKPLRTKERVYAVIR